MNEYDVKLHNTLNSAIAGSSAGINTVTIGLAGEGVHTLKSLNNKLTIGSINVINSGVGYENKQRTCGPAGVSTSLDVISIKNHDYKTGEIVRYTTDGTVISGLTNQTEYYVTAIDADKFKLSQVGVGTTTKDFFLKTDQFVELTSIGSGIHNFNYQPISVEVTGKVGIASTAGSEFKATVQPLFRGQISSIHITNTGVGYGASDIINFKRDPEIKLKSGVGAQLRPIIDQVGRIRDVIVNRAGEEYNSSPHLVITDGTGSGEGALLIPEIVNGNIVSVKVAKSGVGYGVSTTSIQVVPAGEGVSNFLPNCKLGNSTLFKRI